MLDRPLVPVITPEDAGATYGAIRPYLSSAARPIVVHVIEKAGGAPDKAGVDQRREHAEETFDAFRHRADLDGIECDTEVLYGTDVPETILAAAEELGASAVVFRSRGDGGFFDRLTGTVRAGLVDSQKHPVIVLPELGESNE